MSVLPDEVLIEDASGNIITIKRPVGTIPREQFTVPAGTIVPNDPNNIKDEMVIVGPAFYIDGSNLAWYDPDLQPGAVPDDQQAQLGFASDLTPIIVSGA